MGNAKTYWYLTVLSAIVTLGSALFLLSVYRSNAKDTVHKIIVKAGKITDKDEILVDYSKHVGVGSPFVFGGVHAPDIKDQAAWDLIADAGVTVIRRDFFIEYELPQNITLEDYKSNKNNIQNPSKWNWSSGWTNINMTNAIYKNARKRGLKVIGIISYIPQWLGHSGIHSVPKDWGVYKDIVKKLYKIHRPYLDYAEIWNEPDYFDYLDVTNSGLTKAEAYLKIFTVASQAIREVDAQINDGKKTLILAPAVSDTYDASLLESLLKSDAAGYLDGISIHSYGKTEPSWTNYLTLMNKYGKGDLPIYITEWNKTSDYIKDNPYTAGSSAITYTGGQLIDFLKYGVAGANYYSITRFDSSSQDKYANAFGFYTKTGSKVSVLPQGKTWRVLSRDLDLGMGRSSLVYTEQGSNLKTLGAITHGGKPVLAVVNDENTPKLISIKVNNLPVSGNKVQIRIYTASPTEDGTHPSCSEVVDIVNNGVSFKTVMTGSSVNGITLTQPALSLNPVFNALGVNTGQGCIFQ